MWQFSLSCISPEPCLAYLLMKLKGDEATNETGHLSIPLQVAHGHTLAAEGLWLFLCKFYHFTGEAGHPFLSEKALSILKQVSVFLSASLGLMLCDLRD